MKSIFLAFSFLIVASLNGQHLNSFGHIIGAEKSEELPLVFDKGHISVTYNGKLYPGNLLVQLQDGFITIDNSCGNTPSTVRIYDSNGSIKSSFQYGQTINPETDPSRRYLYFQNHKTSVILDTETLEEKILPTTYDIAVNTKGEAVYYDPDLNAILSPKKSIEIAFIPLSIELDDTDNIYIFGKNEFMIAKGNAVANHAYQNGQFFESKRIQGNVYWVEKRKDAGLLLFELNQMIDHEKTTTDKTVFDMAANRKQITHRGDGQQIVCPMKPDIEDYPFRIGNSYAEHQVYGGQPYLHPGVDIIGIPGQAVYSPVDGVVKAVLTTGGAIYWRIAISLTDSSAEQEGYLYAHLEELSIPFSEGDVVNAGDFLGYLVPWPSYEFHHLHFARLKHSGEIWDGNWLTIDNVLSDIINFKDDSPPVFEPLSAGQTIAFRSLHFSEIIPPHNLHGSFDIVCHVHDKSNDDWRVDVDSIGFEIIDLNTDEVVYEQSSFSYDFEIDTYYTNENTTKILYTIYSADDNWYTTGNYNTRNFYQQISRTNGDGVIDFVDAATFFDSTQLPDGDYLIRVHAYDAVGNHNFTEVAVVINNMVSSATDLNSEPLIFPNPNNGHFQINLNDVQFSAFQIHDFLGQKIQDIPVQNRKSFNVAIAKSGFYTLSGFNLLNELIFSTHILVDIGQ